jgi:hypothetical protein
MISGQKIQIDQLLWFLSAAFLLLLIGQFGKQAMGWLLLKLYELFIQYNPIKV